jgi:hypothetical protein
MIEHVWSVLCSHSFYDIETKNASLIEALEQINVPKDTSFPVQIAISFDLVSLWLRTPHNKPAKGLVRVLFVTPSEEKSDPIELQIDLTKTERHRTRFRFTELPIKEPGYHYFMVQYRQGKSKWKDAAKLPLSIRLQVPSQP